MNDFLRDLRHAVRQLLRQPAFAAAAIGSLALGIGLNTTLFSVVNAVLLRDNAMAAPDRLVEIYTGLVKDYPQLTTSYPDFLDIQRGATALQGTAANAYARGILSTHERGVLVTGEAVTANYFDLLGVAVSRGRAFRAEEGAPGASTPVVVLSHALWQQQFGSREGIVGETLKLSGTTYTIIGVATPQFTGTLPGIPTEFWVPVTMIDRLEFSGVQASKDTLNTEARLPRVERRGTRWLFVKGRLADGRTIDEARAQIETIFSGLNKTYPSTNEDVTVSVVPAKSVRFHPMLDGYIKAASAGLLAAVSLVLLIACANVASLLLARGAARQRELAIRASIGASRNRLVRQLLAESLLLSALGGGLGIAMAWWAGRLLSGLGSDVFPMPIAFQFSIDPTVLTFAIAISMATSLLFGLAPAWSSSRPELVPALKDMTIPAGRRFTVRDALVVGQLALSLVLLVCGTLLSRGLLTAERTDLGFDPRPIASLSFNLRMNGYDEARAKAFHDRAADALGRLPGVVSVSTASRLPLAPDINMDGVMVPGYHAPAGPDTPVDSVRVGPNYFSTVGVPLVEGREFTRDDVEQNRYVAVINEAMAHQFWPNTTPLGKTLYLDGFQSKPYEVVGIARDHKVRSVGEAPRPYLHLPAALSPNVGLVVRTAAAAAPALPMLRQALWQIEPDIVFTADVSADEIAATTVAPTRMGAAILGAFGLLALILAAVGVYGVVAYSVSRRTREVGIRMALGAPRARVLRMVLWQGSRLAATGILIGALAAVGAGRVLESLLYGVSSVDPLAYAVACGVLLLVATLANLVPAMTAARIDPMRALRAD
jgi:predicted permease